MEGASSSAGRGVQLAYAAYERGRHCVCTGGAASRRQHTTRHPRRSRMTRGPLGRPLKRHKEIGCGG